MSEEACQSNDKVIYREKHSEHWGSFDDSLFTTDKGGIGIDVAGTVYVRTLKEWHKLESENKRLQNKEVLAVGAIEALEKKAARLREGLEKIAQNQQEVFPEGHTVVKAWQIAKSALEDKK